MASPSNQPGSSGGQPSEQPPPPPGRKGYIPEELQLQAKKNDRSPVVSEILVSARKGYTAEVTRELREGGPKRAAVVDKVFPCTQTLNSCCKLHQYRSQCEQIIIEALILIIFPSLPLPPSSLPPSSLPPSLTPSLPPSKNGRTCLHLACLHGRFDTALAILQTELVDINSANKVQPVPNYDFMLESVPFLPQRGLTPLHDASGEGHTRVVLLLLAMGAYIHARTKEGWTCLMCACSNGHLQLAQLLMAAGSDLHSYTKVCECACVCVSVCVCVCVCVCECECVCVCVCV